MTPIHKEKKTEVSHSKADRCNFTKFSNPNGREANALSISTQQYF